ncbi:NAD(P)/FAD-dependent oxidoreductase [Thioalkalivibrio sp. HK1]|uniref:NAD(P)/FAD-dependent oxidoreductase n=1 Tax=Thioalkalivibrio sp. HK1 TaxID=1469245 RepID=UPI00056E8144|nr:FAD-dependent oxidoreductase [Thioalkalivibrio sp. HK1]
MPSKEYDAVVIGAGLVGAAIAYGLVRIGLRVAVLDEGDSVHRPSHGNFGLVWVQGKGVGRPEYARWTLESSERWFDLNASLVEDCGVDPGYRRPGGITPALSEDELCALKTMLERVRSESAAADFEFEILDDARIRTLLPACGPEVVGGAWTAYDGHVDPLRLLRALHASLDLHGARVRSQTKVRAIVPLPGGGFEIAVASGPSASSEDLAGYDPPKGSSLDGGETNKRLQAQRVVIAAGHGSKALGSMVGIEVPVSPEHGQILVTERTASILEYPTLSVRQSDEGSILLGGSKEDRGFDISAPVRTSAEIAARSLRIFPQIAKLRIVRSWGALRVMTPDGFPIYAASDEYAGAFAVACHSGVTLAANHVWQTSRWIERGTIPPEMACFSPRRFESPSSDVSKIA